jgi:hypothetical protein
MYADSTRGHPGEEPKKSIKLGFFFVIKYELRRIAILIMNSKKKMSRKNTTALWRSVIIITAILLCITMRCIKSSPSTATESTPSASTPAPGKAPVAIPTPILMLSKHKSIPCTKEWLVMPCNIGINSHSIRTLYLTNSCIET